MEPSLETSSLDPPLTSLDPLETNLARSPDRATPLSQPPAYDPCLPKDPTLHPDVRFRHSGWTTTRARVYAGLRTAGVPDRRLEAFANCGRHAWVYQSPDDPAHLRIAADQCHDRFCLPCGQARSRTIARNVLAMMPPEGCRLITLTLRGNQAPLEITVKDLRRYFARLRYSKLWRRTQVGGVAFLEMKVRKNNTGWNVHLHVVAHGRYIPSDELSRTWKRITGGSFIVDVRYVRDQDKAAQYITKYASKPLDATVVRDPVRLAQAITALRNVRLAWTFGDWRGARLFDQPPYEDWIPVAPLAKLLGLAAIGDPQSMQIIAILKGNTKCQTRAPPPSPQRLLFNDGPEPFHSTASPTALTVEPRLPIELGVPF